MAEGMKMLSLKNVNFLEVCQEGNQNLCKRYRSFSRMNVFSGKNIMD